MIKNNHIIQNIKSIIFIICLFLFQVFYSCNTQVNERNKLIENQLFGQIENIIIKTFENDILKSKELKFYKKDGVIQRNEMYFEPNLSSIITIYEYDNKNRLKKEFIVTDGDTTFTYVYTHNNLGLEKKDEYYLNKLHSTTSYKLNSFGKIIEKKFKYEDTNGIRTFKYYYLDDTITTTKEFLNGKLDKTTSLTISHNKNKKIQVENHLFPQAEVKIISYFDNLGNIIKNERYYNNEIKEVANIEYEFDDNENWIKSKTASKVKDRIIKYY